MLPLQICAARDLWSERWRRSAPSSRSASASCRSKSPSRASWPAMSSRSSGSPTSISSGARFGTRGRASSSEDSGWGLPDNSAAFRSSRAAMAACLTSEAAGKVSLRDIDMRAIPDLAMERVRSERLAPAGSDGLTPSRQYTRDGRPQRLRSSRPRLGDTLQSLTTGHRPRILSPCRRHARLEVHGWRRQARRLDGRYDARADGLVLAA